MSLTDYLRSALHHWLIILVCGFGGAVAGLLVAQVQPAQFQTAARFVIAPDPAVEDANNIAQSLDALANKRAIVSTFAQVVLSQSNFDRASNGAGLPRAQAKLVKVSAVVSPEANVVEVFVLARQPEVAEKMLVLLGEEATTSFQGLYSIYTEQSLDAAGPKTEQVAPKPLRNALIAGVLGAGIGFLFGLGADRIRADRAARAGRDPRVTGPDAEPSARDHPGTTAAVALSASDKSSAVVDSYIDPGQALVVHPSATLNRGEGIVPDRGSLSGSRQSAVMNDAAPWMHQLNELASEVRRWSGGVSEARQEEEDRRRWRAELDDLNRLLRDWDGEHPEASNGDAAPDPRSTT